MKRVAIYLLAAVALVATVEARPGRAIYTSGYKVASGTSAVLTLENAIDSTREARLISVEVYLEAQEGDVTIARDASSISGGSGLAEAKLSVYHGDDAVPTARVAAKSGATVAGGTSLPAARPIPAGVVMVISCDDIELVPGENLAITVAADSSDAITVIAKWEEYPAE